MFYQFLFSIACFLNKLWKSVYWSLAMFSYYGTYTVSTSSFTVLRSVMTLKNLHKNQSGLFWGKVKIMYIHHLWYNKSYRFKIILTPWFSSLPMRHGIHLRVHYSIHIALQGIQSVVLSFILNVSWHLVSLPQQLLTEYLLYNDFYLMDS